MFKEGLVGDGCRPEIFENRMAMLFKSVLNIRDQQVEADTTLEHMEALLQAVNNTNPGPAVPHDDVKNGVCIATLKEGLIGDGCK